eukprot:6212724-Pleurochrysis_carterae.AAC.4
MHKSKARRYTEWLSTLSTILWDSVAAVCDQKLLLALREDGGLLGPASPWLQCAEVGSDPKLDVNIGDSPEVESSRLSTPECKFGS